MYDVCAVCSVCMYDICIVRVFAQHILFALYTVVVLCIVLAQDAIWIQSQVYVQCTVLARYSFSMLSVCSVLKS